MRLPIVSWLAAFAVGALSACGGGSGPASMEFVEVSPAQPRIGEVITVRFKLLDSRGMPLAGQEVRFRLVSENKAVTLSPEVATSQKGGGTAETYLQVNGRVTSVVVEAKAGDKTVLSPSISIAGAVANGRQLVFQCGAISGSASGGMHAIGAYDWNRLLIAGVKLECTAHVGDRNSDGVSGALVSFMTEAGAIGPTQISMTDVIGNATILHKTSTPLPLDVAPATFKWNPTRDLTHTGSYVAPMWMEPYAWVRDPTKDFPDRQPAASGLSPAEPSRNDPLRRTPDGSKQMINNPRDNLVAMIAVTSGEEGFSDDNNNGTWDEGEPFDDLTEPFVDSNDNGTWDPEEKFIDANGNKSWDGANDEWDANTLIWTQERILWTGYPHTSYDRFSVPPLVAQYDPPLSQPLNFDCPELPTPCRQAHQADGGAKIYVSFLISDPWYNTIAQDSSGDKCEVESTPDIEATTVNTWSGIRLAYPMAAQIGISLMDARDPSAAMLPDGGAPVPKRDPPNVYTANVYCNYTSSPMGGYVMRLPVGSVSGRIE
jgi:hypothetical protein